MAFESAIVNSFPIGSRKMAVGTWQQSAGDNGGTITTGLGDVQWYLAVENAGNGKDLGMNFSLSSGNIVVSDTQPNFATSGVWMVIGT